MRIFFDSSAFAKRYLDEAGSEEVEAACFAASALGVCRLCVPEVVSAFNRRLRDSSLPPEKYLLVKNRLLEEVRDAETVDLTPEVIVRSLVVLETNVLRASDALHVASALEWGAELFVSSDQRQLRAANKSGLATRQV